MLSYFVFVTLPIDSMNYITMSSGVCQTYNDSQGEKLTLNPKISFKKYIVKNFTNTFDSDMTVCIITIPFRACSWNSININKRINSKP